MKSLNELLTTKKEDIKRLPNIPPGLYRMRIEGHTIGDRGEMNEIISFRCKPIAAQEDVDADELAALAFPIEQLNQRVEFWFSKDPDREADNANQLANLDEFLDKLGIDASNDESPMERLPMANNCEFVAQVENQARKSDPNIIDDRIVKTFSLDDVTDLV